MNGFVTAAEALADGTRIVSVEGEIDMETAPRFETELRAAIEDGAHRLIVNLTDCGFFDSSGLNVLVRTRKQLNDPGSLAVIATQPMVRKVFEITHLDGVFQIHPTRAEAINGSRSATRGDHDPNGSNMPSKRRAPTQEEIAQRAYELSQSESSGTAEENWHRAESEPNGASDDSPNPAGQDPDQPPGPQ